VKAVKLYLRMLRYRSAIVMVLFMLLGAAWHGSLSGSAVALFVAAIALISTYGCATSVNDLADWKIDQINLKGHTDRPLVSGDGSRRDLVVNAVISSAIALVLGLTLGLVAAAIIGLVLAMNLIYSLPPTKVSYRAMLTPFYLVIGYIVLPYWLGVVLIGSHIGSSDALFLPALYCLFLARISLKDFRDRKGDAKNNKPTLILVRGKQFVCRLSLTALVLGSLLLLLALKGHPWVMLGLVPYMVALVATIRRLATTDDRLKELISIGFGARIGNGMLFVLLGLLLLQDSHTQESVAFIFYLSLMIVYGSTFIEFWKDPSSFEFGKSLGKEKQHAPAKG